MLTGRKIIWKVFGALPKCRRVFSVSTEASNEKPDDHASDSSKGSSIDGVPDEIGVYSRELEFPSPYRKPLQCWIESIKEVKDRKVGMMNLHPSIWHVNPRIDIIFKNIYWQSLYRKIDYSWTPRIHEMKGGGRKPWPQKETGRARQGSNRAPQWVKGYVVHGPRGPKSYFFMPPKMIRVQGLCTTLTFKFHQNTVHVVDDFMVPSDDPEFFKDIADERFWGSSVLFVDDADIMPKNITTALETIPSFNLMPLYGLNVYSMLKHETLILTVRAVEKLEHKLLCEINALDRYDKKPEPLWMP